MVENHWFFFRDSFRFVSYVLFVVLDAIVFEMPLIYGLVSGERERERERENERQRSTSLPANELTLLVFSHCAFVPIFVWRHSSASSSSSS